MRSITYKLKPKNGFSHLLHIGYNILFPLFLYILFILFGSWPAIVLIIISKWRVFAVRPRYWLPNLRANGVDIIIAFSYLAFLTDLTSTTMRLILIVLYAIWLTLIKPKSSSIYIGLQAFLAQFIGLMAVFGFQSSSTPSSALLIIATWLVCYITARHFFSMFDEPFTSLYSHTWGYFGASLVWVLSHWLIYYYGTYAQPTILLSVIGFSLGSLFYLKQNERLNIQLRRQIVMVMVAILFVVVFLSDWSSKTF
jgi:hypothetical protein